MDWQLGWMDRKMDRWMDTVDRWMDDKQMYSWMDGYIKKHAVE